MAETTLVATTGRPLGSAASRRLRREDLVPGVLYGLGMAPVSVTVERRELRLALSGPAGINTILSLEVDGAKHPALVKEIQRHPVRRTVSHVDFLTIDLREELTVSIPVRLEGTAKAVEDEGGLVDAAVDSIEVTTTPANMPNEIVIDISALTPHDVIRLADITFSEGVTPTGDPDLAIVTVMFPSSAAAEEAAAEEAEGAEGEEAGAAGETEGGEAGE